MGIEYSFFSVLNHYTKSVETTKTKPDGTIIISKPNSYVSMLTVASATLIMIMYMDGGKGMISKLGGKTCLQCNNNM
jgi:hypothetical protein